MHLAYSQRKKMCAFSLAQKYCDEVANPMDMILFRKMKSGDKARRVIHDRIDDLDDITELFQGDVKTYNFYYELLNQYHFSIVQTFSFYR